MQWFRAVLATVAGVVATIVVVVACLVFGFYAFMGWLVTCTGLFYESGCDRSSNPWLNLGFLATAIVLVVGAALTIGLIVRLLGRWISPQSGAASLTRHAAVTAALAVVAVVGVAGGSAVGEAIRAPTRSEVQAQNPDLYRCLEVPEPARAEIQGSFLTGEAQTLSGTSDKIRVARAEPAEWALVEGVGGSWIAARIDYAQEVSSTDSDDGWRPFGDATVTALYYLSSKGADSVRVYRYGDLGRYYNAQISSLPYSPDGPRESDLRALGACLECDPNDRVAWNPNDRATWTSGCHWTHDMIGMGWQVIATEQ